MGFGFESRGCAFVAENTIGGDLNCSGGRFINPGNAALEGGGSDIGGWVVLGAHPMGLGGDFVANGLVMFEHSQVGATFGVINARFEGKASEQHGLFVPGISVRNEFIWWNAKLENGGSLDLSDARVGSLLDEDMSWPIRGQLLINGLTYGGLAGGTSYAPQWKSPVDARSRLRWLALQPGYHPQPYRQLAHVLRENGDDAGATQVLIAEDDARYRDSSFLLRAWAGFLKATIGYGHQPLRTVLWMAGVILLGWMVTRGAKRAGLMRPTYPENAPSADIRYERLYPLLYSLDVFLPFVNLHQEHYWWPDSEGAGDLTILGRTIRIRGPIVLYYLWLQIIAGWLLSAIFVAGVTGLIRGD